MIKFSNVSLIYPNSTTTVLEDLNLEIAEGEMVLVIGPTGSGKSSLLRLLSGVQGLLRLPSGFQGLFRFWDV